MENPNAGRRIIVESVSIGVIPNLRVSVGVPIADVFSRIHHKRGRQRVNQFGILCARIRRLADGSQEGEITPRFAVSANVDRDRPAAAPVRRAFVVRADPGDFLGPRGERIVDNDGICADVHETIINGKQINDNNSDFQRNRARGRVFCAFVMCHVPSSELLQPPTSCSPVHASLATLLSRAA